MEAERNADINALPGVRLRRRGSLFEFNCQLIGHLVVRIVFGVFFILNVVLWTKGSSAAVPFTTLLALLALWFGISVPLTFVGAFFGFRKRVSH